MHNYLDYFITIFVYLFAHVFPAEECNSGDVRLMGGPNNRAGRVELCYQGIWGTLTDDSWGTRDAKVICRMLGFFPGRKQK